VRIRALLLRHAQFCRETRASTGWFSEAIHDGMPRERDGCMHLGEPGKNRDIGTGQQAANPRPRRADAAAMMFLGIVQPRVDVEPEDG